MLIQDNRTGHLGLNNFILINIHTNQRDFSTLNNNQQLLTALEGITDISSIHFNYTGATKSMMLSGYSQCKIWADTLAEPGKNFRFILSDLTPRTFFLKLLIKEFPNQQIFSIELPEPQQNIGRHDLRDLVVLSLRDILKLHSIKISNISLTKNHFYNHDSIMDLIELKLNQHPIPINWGNYMENLIFLFEHPEQDQMTIPVLVQIQNLLYLLIDTPLEYTIPRLIEEFDNAGDIFNNDEDFEALMEQAEFRGRLRELTNFITGKYFEDYAHEILREWHLDPPIFTTIRKKNYVYFHFHHKNVVAETLKGRDMEFDLVIIKGYQLFIISLTTSVSPELVKEKAFEVLHRALQIGGDGAKGIVISFLDHEEESIVNVHDLEYDFRALIGQKKLKIYGTNIINKDDNDIIEGNILNLIKQITTSHIILESTEEKEVEIESNEEEDILILNIGKNSLPNYIIARCTLLEFNGAQQDLIRNLPHPTRIILIHSNKTDRFAHNIEQILRIEPNIAQFLDPDTFVYLNIGNFHRNLNYINNHILDLLNQFNSINSLHFGYMGGTKPMALGAYRTINDFIEVNNIPTLVYSDLDSDNFRMNLNIINNLGNNHLIFPAANQENLKHIIELPTQHLINLYDFILNNHLNPILLGPLLLVDNNNNDIHITNQTIENIIQNAGFDPNNINIVTDRQFGHQISPIRFLFSIGYQLFLISFSKAEKIGAIKKDAFEVKYLAEILGGEYAIGILLVENCLNQYEFSQLKEDLAEFQAKKTCIILDAPHINLLDNIITNGNTIDAWNHLIQ
jgi:hypothetical protein